MISQPLVYVVEIPTLGGFKWQYYIYWAKLTVLTFPAGIIAYFLRKQTWWGAALLAVTAAVCLIPAASYVVTVITEVSNGLFPYHILSVVFCVVALVVYCIAFRKDMASRIVCLVATVALLVAFGVATYEPFMQNSYGLPDATGEWSAEFDGAAFGEVSVDQEGNSLMLQTPANCPGEAYINCTNTDGTTVRYHIVSAYSEQTHGFQTDIIEENK